MKRIPFRTSVLSLIAIAGLICIAAPARGQSPLDGFDLNAQSSHTFFSGLACVVQPDGKILIGGGFETVLGQPRHGVARLNPDGTLDLAFNATGTWDGGVYTVTLQADGKILIGGGFNSSGHIGIARLDPTTGIADSFTANTDGIVYAIVLQADGKILVGGSFKNIGGRARNYIARLDPTNGAVDSFNANATAGFGQYIQTIAVQRDGKILVGGFFSNIGGQMRNTIARLDPVSGLADSFNPNPNSEVDIIVVQPDNKILVGGVFNSIGGQSRSRIARLDPVTGLADSFNPSANGPVVGLLVQPDGKILVGGGFFGIGGRARKLIARLDPVTGLVDTFDPNANQAVCCVAPNVYAFAVQPDGKVLVGGDFIGMAPNGGPQIARSRIARLEKDGFADQTLDLSAVGTYIDATAVQPDGKTVIAGLFSSILGLPRNNVARLNTDGSLDMAFNPNATGEIFALAVQTDGKILLGGRLTNIGGQPRNRIARIDGTTGLADSFDPNASSDVLSIAVQADGKILASGTFTTIGGQTRNRIARLDAATGLADSFDPNANSAIYSIAVQADGKIVAGGFFNGPNSIGGQTRNYIARLDGKTGLADSFAPNPDSFVYAIALQADGKILAAGNFANIGGQMRNRMARLDGTTGLADAFDPNPNDWVLSIAPQADGKILASGYFTNIGGQKRDRLARLDAISGSADSFNPDANDLVISTAIRADGKILAGGKFTNIGGQARNLFARLTNDIPAGQDLSATPGTVMWSRSGASPQLSRVTFEFSTDNANYTSLGKGTYAGNVWTLSGLSLPNAQTFYIRARGYYRTGQNNGSESIAESVRSVFLHEVTVANVVSRKMHGSAGTFDVNLPHSRNPGIECRSGGANGNYQLVFSFANPLTSVGSASLTSGTGTVSSRLIDSNDAHNYIVNLTGIGNGQTINVTLTNVNDSAGNSSSSVTVPMSVLLGDVDGNGIVNATDVAQTKANSGQMLDTANFRDDATANGSINASDVALIKSCSGTGVPVDRGRLSVSKR